MYERSANRMKALHLKQPASGALPLWVAFAICPSRACATGTARIQRPDGSVSTYRNVRIGVQNQSMSITSSDGQGTVVISKAACSRVGELLRCIQLVAAGNYSVNSSSLTTVSEKLAT